MQKNIIFFDIDGTILSHRNRQISESTRTAIRKARANGHLAFINSGRTMAEIDSTIREVGFDGYVCGCGTYVSYHDDVLLHTVIPQELCSMLIEDFNRYQMEALLESASSIYYNGKATTYRLMPSPEHLNNIFQSQIQDWNIPGIQFDKFCIWCDDAKLYKDFYDKYKTHFDFIDRGNHFYEIIPQGYSKASGIQFLISHLDIPHENTYAFGDSANDLPMLQYVKHSIGMGNSDGGVPEVVSYLTKDVDQDGIEHALKHFNII